jgi:tetratricopeptide (TPR) repeat protein
MNQLLFGHLFRLAVPILLVTMATAQDHPPDKSASSQEPAPSNTSKKETSSSADQVIFRDARGRELKAKDLAGITGTINWSIAGSEDVPEHARDLHDLGQQEGSAGHYAKALLLFAQAQREAPKWPYPAYDAAYTSLLNGDLDQAERDYAVVERLSPRGFFTAKAEMDCIRRERAKEFAPGTCKSYVLVADMSDSPEKRAAWEGLLRQSPSLAPAWKGLSVLLPDDDAKMGAIAKGLSYHPDGDTRGVLLINKALILNRQGKHSEAVSILGNLALDPQSTLMTEQLAKASLANLPD